MNVVMLVPTGIGCTIGGHAGDANPVARLLGSVCDNLLLHPNVVNASDLNEMPDNAWYIEGSILDRFLDGCFYLYKPRMNRILLVANSPLTPDTINSANASRKTLGTNIEIVTLDTELKMTGIIEDGIAAGMIEGAKELVEQVSKYDFDALAIHSKVFVGNDTAMDYLHNGGVNPYGAVEALLSKYVALRIDKPVAHAPIEELEEPYDGVSDPRMAASIISNCYLNSVLKGLHKAPQITTYQKPGSLQVGDIDCLVTPYNCVGDPHISCLQSNIPVIAVADNRTNLKDEMPPGFIKVSNYIEAAGVISAMEAGISIKSLLTEATYNFKYGMPYDTSIHGCSA